MYGRYGQQGNLSGGTPMAGTRRRIMADFEKGATLAEICERYGVTKKYLGRLGCIPEEKAPSAPSVPAGSIAAIDRFMASSGRIEQIAARARHAGRRFD